MNVMGIALLLQGSDFSLPGSNNNLMIAFLCLLAVAVLLQAFVLLAMAIGARKTQKKMVEMIENFGTRLNPLLDTTRVLLDDTAPKVRIITTNIAQASYILREQAEEVRGAMGEVRGTVGELNKRVRGRIVLVDEMIGAGLITLDRAVSSVQEGILGPMRQLNGLLAGLRTGFDVLRNRGRKTHNTEDQNMFV
jgi:hypothetical protein